VGINQLTIMQIPKTRVELEHEVLNMVAVKLLVDPNKIRLDDDLIEDLGADSLALAELTMQVEERTGIKVRGDAWLDVFTIRQLLDLIEEHQA